MFLYVLCVYWLVTKILKWLSERHFLLVSRNVARWHPTAYCRLVASQCHNVYTTHVYLWHAGRQRWCSRPRLSQVRWSTYATQRRQRPHPASSGVSQCPVKTQCPETMENVLTVWLCCPGLMVVAWSGVSHVRTLWQPVTWTVPCYLSALRLTRLNVGKW